MKKIIYTILIGLLFSSCELDLEPKNSTTFEHFFKNESDLFALVAQIHGELRESMCKVTYHEHMGEYITYVSNGASEFEKLRNYDPNLLSNKSKQQQWRSYYNVLNLADLFMDNYHKAQNVNKSRLDFCVGQCYFARAVCYFILARTWGDAVITKGSLYNQKYAKSPSSQVIDTAIFYAKEAYNILPRYEEMRGNNGRILTSKQYGCKGSAAAILVHLNAWKGAIFNDKDAYAEAVAWADKLIEADYKNEIGDYELAADPETVCTKVLKRQSSEGIFEIETDFVNSDHGYFIPGIYLLSYPIKRNSTPQDALSCSYGIYKNNVLELYRENDKRREAYFYQPENEEISNSANLAYLYKWRYALYRNAGEGMPAAFRNLDCNKIITRLADIYLLRAECNNKLGLQDKAIQDLNKIRERAGAALFPDANRGESNENLGLIIFREREKELLLEGHRYYDVIRNGYYREELGEGFKTLTDTDIKNGALYLPIPSTAFNNNDLMIQNTYWISKMK